MTQEEYAKLEKLRSRHKLWVALKWCSLSQMVGAVIVSTFFECGGEPGMWLGFGGLGLGLLFEKAERSAKQSLDAFEARFKDE